MATKKKTRRVAAPTRAALVSELRTYIAAAVNNTRKIASTEKESRELHKLAAHLRELGKHADPDAAMAWGVFASMAEGEAKRLKARSLELKSMLEAIDQMAGATADRIVKAKRRAKAKPRKS
jgi:hypothetical protein